MPIQEKIFIKNCADYLGNINSGQIYFISDVERAKWKSTLFHFRAEELTQGIIPRRSAGNQNPEIALGSIRFIFVKFGVSDSIVV
ncbi:MAG: hypothetical protein COW93_01080 [Parcubacteria group bacterium CG22_combo_CG10-13_8_21_14_all_41_9]|nr:MAG: hypothetical protein COW93_01080 [Parcubacteria group bacterium CG22_combo_CG10-13_8_21_14_all_41_9]